MFCTNCGSALAGAANFCPCCGSRSAAAAPPVQSPNNNNNSAALPLQPPPGLPPLQPKRAGAPAAPFQPLQQPQPFQPPPGRQSSGPPSFIPPPAARPVDPPQVIPPPPVAFYATEGLGIDCAIAGPWPRFWARSLDWSIEYGICTFLIGYLLAGPMLTYYMRQPLFMVVFIVCVNALVMCLDAVCYVSCSNTPGKWLMGIHVLEASGRPLTLAEYLSRNMGVLLRGYALGIPLVSLFTLIYGYRKSSRGELLDWDAKRNSRPFRMHSEPWRIHASAAAVFAVSLIFTLPYVIPAVRAASAAGNGSVMGNATPVNGMPVNGTPTVVSAPSGTPVDSIRRSGGPDDPRLQEIVNGMNQGVPKMVDDNVRFDGAEDRGGGVLAYNYTIMNISLAAIAPALRERTHEAMLNAMQQPARAVWHGVCSSADSGSQELAALVSTAQFQYRDRDGADIGYVTASCADSAP